MHKIQLDLRAVAKPDKVSVYKNFFKTGVGQYGEGDEFIGVTMPDNRKIAKTNITTSFGELSNILESKVHEDRMCALLILVYKFDKAKSDSERKEIVDFYVQHRLRGNNWDLIDCIADKILGKWLIDRDKSILYNYAKSNNLWERRISIISTFEFIKKRKFEDTFRIAEILMNDKHDLIHKAVGWMLREIGKRNKAYLETFLQMHYKKMPRTMLRYAIEKFPEARRKMYLKGEI